MATVDLRFWDGSEWVSVGDVAADKVTLPVPSADGTVVLDSPEAGTFSIETNGEDRASFTGDGRVQFGSTAPSPNVGVGMQIKMPSSAAEISLFNSPYINASSTSHTCEYLRPYLPLSGSMGDLRFSYCVLTNNPVDHTIQNVTGYSVDAAVAVGESTNIGFASSIGPRAGNWNIYASGAAPNYFRGQVLTYSGLASAPAISTYGDEDTGTWSPAANTWAVSTGGVERLRVSSDGNIGVGVAPSQTHRTSIRQHDPNFNYPVGVYLDQRLTKAVSTNSFGILTALNAQTACSLVVAFQCNGANTANGGTVNEFRGYAHADVSGTDVTRASAVHLGMMKRAGLERWNVFAGGSAPNFLYGQVQTGLGTAPAPAVSIFGDTDTGTFSPAANTWAVSTGGVERVRVTQEGNVGVGVSPSSTHRLGVRQTGITENNPVALYLNQVIDNAATKTSYLTLSGISIDGVSPTKVVGQQINGPVLKNGATLGEFFGFSCSDFNGMDKCAGFLSSVAFEAGKDKWNFYADGTAPNFFNADIYAAARITGPNGPGTHIQLTTSNEFVLFTNGSEQLRVSDSGDLQAAAGYTPANPQSLATKAYVDSNASLSDAVTLYQIVTPSEYAALTEYDPHVMYLVTENDQTAPPVDQDNALAHTIVTRTEFDALPTKDEHTIYIIKG